MILCPQEQKKSENPSQCLIRGYMTSLLHWRWLFSQNKGFVMSHRPAEIIRSNLDFTGYNRETLITKIQQQIYLCHTRNPRSSLFWTPQRRTVLLPHHAPSSSSSHYGVRMRMLSTLQPDREAWVTTSRWPSDSTLSWTQTGRTQTGMQCSWATQSLLS